MYLSLQPLFPASSCVSQLDAMYLSFKAVYHSFILKMCARNQLKMYLQLCLPRHSYCQQDDLQNHGDYFQVAAARGGRSVERNMFGENRVSSVFPEPPSDPPASLPRLVYLPQSDIFLDAIASPSTYPSDWVSE